MRHATSRRFNFASASTKLLPKARKAMLKAKLELWYLSQSSLGTIIKLRTYISEYIKQARVSANPTHELAASVRSAATGTCTAFIIYSFSTVVAPK